MREPSWVFCVASNLMKKEDNYKGSFKLQFPHQRVGEIDILLKLSNKS